MALRKSGWFRPTITAWRAFSLLKGGCSQFGRKTYWLPVLALTSVMLRSFSTSGSRS